MTRIPLLVLLATLTALGMQFPPENAVLVTFNKDVFPILQEHRQSCHRPGGIAPMSLMTYERARPWAKAIKAKVLSREMPPWFANAGSAPLRNAPLLTDADIHTIHSWVESGAREGDTADKPQYAKATLLINRSTRRNGQRDGERSRMSSSRWKILTL